ncbi:hypothetical protein FACS1894176_06040 [Bacteroidia bacterium]|nr:hypothetical protein FACS1894176_06040 [Bacteroidia bacterium]
MKYHYLVALSIVFTFTACSPHVGSMITKTYPVNETDKSVTVFMEPSLAPAHSESLGVVSIMDTGFSTKCDSVTVVELLKEEAHKAGGNAVVVTEYIRPSIWRSSCHQMTGTVLRVHDFDSFTQTTDSDFVQLTALKVIQPARKLSKITLSANIGYGWRLAKMDPEFKADERKYQKGLMSGLVGDVSLNYYFNDYYGIGLIYSAYSANQNMSGRIIYEDGSSENGNLKTNDLIQFIGPAFLARTPVYNQKWIFEGNIGIGYLDYTSKKTFESQHGKAYGATVGGYLSLGAEYKVDEYWAIGFRLAEVVGIVTSWTTDVNGYKESGSVDNPQNGIGLGQFQCLAGIRYYIK